MERASSVQTKSGYGGASPMEQLAHTYGYLDAELA